MYRSFVSGVVARALELASVASTTLHASEIAKTLKVSQLFPGSFLIARACCNDHKGGISSG
jgi:hypothetical protein